MAGFDDPGLYYHDRFLGDNDNESGDLNERNLEIAIPAAKKRFKEFIKTFHLGGFSHLYREQLTRHCLLHEYWLEVKFEDFQNFDEELAEKLKRRPTLFHPVFEEAAKEVANELTKAGPEEKEEPIPDIQILLKSDSNAQSIRSIKSSQVSQLVTVSGIIIAASQVRSKATHITIQCRTCRQIKPNIGLKPGLDGYVLPRKCTSDQTAQAQKCPMDPYFIIPDKCKCVDFQVLKLQEAPEDVPHGELPRHLQLFSSRYLTDKVAPGNKVTVFGVYSIKKATKPTGADKDRMNVGIRAPYLRVFGIHVETAGLGRSAQCAATAEEEKEFRKLAAQADVYEKISRSIAPAIFGSQDIKKAIACLLFGGARKRLPDGLARRGDINVLLLGDPGTAKSQLLKFAEKVSPIGVYTSGKGSSAAGLTASVNRDPSSRSFVMEGGAMVLADGGVVCIDEFDKMREDDRVAIHEAMEQQTISIAKAGITTTLNSRCSVLAAANSIYGRWDETKGDENIDFMPTILSRFDMIFVVKDEHNVQRDITLAKHVIGIHMNATDAGSLDPFEAEGELPLAFLKKFIAFCRRTCGPRLNEAAAQKLVNNYVRLRNNPATQNSKSAIPITVRQLEAVVRISESLAKMELNSFANEKHVEEALRLFQVSTLEAASTGSLSGVEGFTTIEEQELMSRIEKQLKRRFAIGTQVSEHVIIQDFVRQRYSEHSVHKVLQHLIRRGEIQYRLQRKMLYRVK